MHIPVDPARVVLRLSDQFIVVVAGRDDGVSAAVRGRSCLAVGSSSRTRANTRFSNATESIALTIMSTNSGRIGTIVVEGPGHLQLHSHGSNNFSAVLRLNAGELRESSVATSVLLPLRPRNRSAGSGVPHSRAAT